MIRYEKSEESDRARQAKPPPPLRIRPARDYKPMIWTVLLGLAVLGCWALLVWAVLS